MGRSPSQAAWNTRFSIGPPTAAAGAELGSGLGVKVRDGMWREALTVEVDKGARGRHGVGRGQGE
jgi:hypothetical protein